MRPQFSLLVLFIAILVAALLLFAITHPTYLVAIAFRLLTFIVAATCLVAACDPVSQFRWPAIAAVCAGALWHLFIEGSIPVIVTDFLVSKLFADIEDFQNRVGYSAAYLRTIVEMTFTLAAGALTSFTVAVRNTVRH